VSGTPAWQTSALTEAEHARQHRALEAFTIYAVGFVARPVGAAIFGH